MNTMNTMKTLLAIFFLASTFLSNAQNNLFNKKDKKLSQQIENLKKLDGKQYVSNINTIKFRAFPIESVKKLKIDLETIGAFKCKVYGKYLTGWIKINKIEAIKGISSIKLITPVECGHSASGSFSAINNACTPYKPNVTTGVTVSQGDKAMLTDIFRDLNQVNGCGVKIGIISIGYDFLKGASKGISDGDLPGIGNPNGFTTPVTVLQEASGLSGTITPTDEGRAMAEIVHDIAPGAELFLYSGTNGIENLAEGYSILADAGVDIIVDDVFYFQEAYFQEGIVTQAIDEVSDRGVITFTINGNIETKFSYEAPFKAVPIDLVPDNAPFFAHDFGNGNVNFINGNGATVNAPILPFIIPANSSARLDIHWDEPSIFANADGPKPVSDIGVLLLRKDNDGVFRRINSTVSNAPINGIPHLSFFFDSFSDQRDFRFVVFSENGSIPQNLKVISSEQTVVIDTLINDPTSFYHAGTTKGITIGAVRYGDTPAFGSTLIPDPFNEALGGQKILLDFSGNRIQNPKIINKPDFMAIDGGNNSFFGSDISGPQDDDSFPNFFGTSAAAPHAAAAAALVLEAFKKTSNRKVLPVEIKEIFNSTATDMLSTGFDFRSGNGFINVDKAYEELLNRENVLGVTDYSKESNYTNEVKFLANYIKKDYSLVNLSKKVNSIEIYNLTGVKVYENKKVITEQIDLNLNSLSKGVYVVKINEENKTSTKKIVL